MLRILLATIVFLLSASLAHAAECAVNIDDLDFSSVDTIGNTPAVTTADVSIECDNISPEAETITLCGNIDAGDGGVEGGWRQIVTTGGTLGFALYTTDGATTPWGSLSARELGDPYEIDLPVNGETLSTTIQLHGVVPAGQSTAPVGDYHAAFSSSQAVFTYAEGSLDCLAPGGGSDAHAPFAVTASVAANCLLETANLDFGTAGLIGTAIEAETDLGITCTDGTGYTIAIDGGGADDPEHRLLRSGGNTVRYDLYSNEQRTLPWGEDPGSTVSGSGDGAEQGHTVYGRIPPQPAAAGAYTDTVVVTIIY